MLVTRADLEAREREFLAAYAIKSGDSKGRKFKEETHDNRLVFQRDRDRVIHCKAFRRLDEKTQVFMAGHGDHYRTRLTHTLEVAQIARHLTRALGLNEDLCEVIALAHDLGHPPFGHGGEEALDEVLQEFGRGFEHNEQSRLVVEKLEKLYPDFDGLNLTYETLEGLIKHQTAFDQSGVEFEVAGHLEAQVVNIADEIAYTNHDIDDGIRSGLISVEELRQFEIWKMAEEKVFEQYGKDVDKRVFRFRVISNLIAIMIEDLCEQTAKNIETFGIVTLEDVLARKKALAEFSEELRAKIKVLRKFLYDNFYMNPKVSGFVQEGKKMIKELFHFYHKNGDRFPGGDSDDFLEEIKNYIAGMTDRFLVQEYEKIC